jgi:HAE1 family hydrophobic/amphiphilic exporter-1/multidrug efflux pump
MGGGSHLRWNNLVIIQNLQTEIAPLEDRNSVRFTVTAAEGTSFSSMEKIGDDVANYLYDSGTGKGFRIR